MPSTKTTLRIGCLAALALALTVFLAIHRIGGPFFYSAPDVRGRIIDESSGRPIEGALVVAMWQLETIGSSPTSILHSGEALTDSDGQYRIAGFRRKLRPLMSWFKTDDPRLLIYKDGYEYGGRSNYAAYIPVITRVGSKLKSRQLPDGRILQVGYKYSSDSNRFCYWDGKDIPLAKAPDTPADQLRVLETFRVLHTEDLAAFPLSRRALAAKPQPRPATIEPERLSLQEEAERWRREHGPDLTEDEKGSQSPDGSPRKEQ